MNLVDPTGLFPSMCDAQYSFQECGGASGFWGGIFGGEVGAFNRYYSGLSSHTVDAMTDWDRRLKNQLDAIRANHALQKALRTNSAQDIAHFQALMDANDQLLMVMVIPPDVQNGLRALAQKYGQSLADIVLFNLVARITGLADHINGYDYNSSTRTFTIDFKPSVEGFLANSPYFAGPGIALLHLDVGKTDYRSYTDMTGGLSLQLVVGNDRSRSYADFDKDNPYQDAVGFFRHNIPIISRWLRSIFK